MPEHHEPTPRELLIRFDSLTQQVASLVRQMEHDRTSNIQQMSSVISKIDNLASTLSNTYIPRDVYAANRQADERRFTDIEKDLETQAGSRRQMIVGVMLAVASAVISVVVALAVARAGAGV
jgi:Flp pilus assembly protein TadB